MATKIEWCDETLIEKMEKWQKSNNAKLPD